VFKDNIKVVSPLFFYEVYVLLLLVTP